MYSKESRARALLHTRKQYRYEGSPPTSLLLTLQLFFTNNSTCCLLVFLISPENHPVSFDFQKPAVASVMDQFYPLNSQEYCGSPLSFTTVPDLMSSYDDLSTTDPSPSPPAVCASPHLHSHNRSLYSRNIRLSQPQTRNTIPTLTPSPTQTTSPHNNPSPAPSMNPNNLSNQQ